MLVSVYHGTKSSDADPMGDMHFEIAPTFRDKVKIGQKLCVITSVWHTPHAERAGAKLGVMVSDKVDTIFQDPPAKR